MGSFSVVVQPSAERELRAVPFPFRRELAHALVGLQRNPFPADAEIIDGDVDRLDVHGWRVVYAVDESAARVVVLRITR